MDLPPNHSYHALDGTLSVTNIMANQNNTQYQCQLLSLSDGELCAYRSTVGQLIIKCRNNHASIISKSGNSRMYESNKHLEISYKATPSQSLVSGQTTYLKYMQVGRWAGG